MNINQRFLFIFALLIIIYVLLLSFNLLALPLYLDEGLYIFWASFLKQDLSYAYLSMQDGKTPLYIWLTHLINPLFQNYLYTGRLISVIASLLTLICSAIIGFKISGKRMALFIGVLFLITPFNILISRMAFVDSLLTALGSLSIMSLFFVKEFAEKKKIIHSLLCAFLTGIFLGLAFLTKTTAKIFLFAEIFILIFWTLQYLKNKKLKTTIILLISIPIILGLYYEILGYLKFGALRYWEMISNKESLLIFNLPEIYGNLTRYYGLIYYAKNIPLFSEYFFIYFGPLLVFFGLGVFRIIKDRKNFWLLLLFIIFTVGVFLSARVLASRYLAIIIPEFIIISSIGLNWIWQKNSKNYKIATIILILFTSIFSLKMIISPMSASYANDDRNYFIESDLNGYGLQEITEYIKPQKDDSIVGVEAIWGVAEGMLTSLEEKGIKTQVIYNIIPKTGTEDQICKGGYKDSNNICWEANFGSLHESPQTQKYIYLTATPDKIESLKMLSNITIIKEFIRPGNTTSYLLKLN